MKKTNLFRILFYFFFSLTATLGYVLLFAALWFTRNFGVNVGFDAILFTLFSDMNGTDTSNIIDYLLWGALPAVICSAATILLIVLLPRLVEKLKTDWHGFLFRTVAMVTAVSFFAATVGFAIYRIGLIEYIMLRSETSLLYEEHYVDPNSVQITFPEEKRNLIYIYLESMEVTFADKANGGALEKNAIPELTVLANNNVNFSQSDGFGGGRTTTGSTWTIAAAISQTSGVPLCLPSDIWENGLNRYTLVMPGLTALGDILSKNGYNQALIMGSNSEFAGQKKFYTQHGTDEVFDLLTARAEGALPSEDYHDGFWGMEDLYVYEYAQTKLREMSRKDEPFAVTLYTIDTHSPYGNVCDKCRTRRGENLSSQEKKNLIYKDVLACCSKQIADFLTWLEAQDFYENTTVIIAGDHYTMNNAFINTMTEEGYVRRTYNCIINSPVEPIKEKNRDFTTLDMFPTTLAAMGCTIEGDRLGLGTNLFSEVPTLCETMGFNTLDKEISTFSPYYNKNFLYATAGN